MPESSTQNPPPPSSAGRKKWRRLRRWTLYGAILTIVVLVGLEWYCRAVLGLGDPPLSINDPQIDHLFVPDQTVHRFGNLVHINHYSQRSDDIPPHKSEPGELRVMMLGDSVTNGGALSDQSQTVTAYLQNDLRADLHVPVYVMNASAGSWSPMLELAYLKRFGLFDADVVILEQGSHNYSQFVQIDNRVDVDPNFPGHKPMFALEEAITRYLIPRLRGRLVAKDTAMVLTGGAQINAIPANIEACHEAQLEIYSLAREAGAEPFLAEYLGPEEMTGDPWAGYYANCKTAQGASVPIIDMGPGFKAAIKNGTNPFRDSIHPDVEGNRVMEQAILPPVEEALKARMAAEKSSAGPSNN
jgi:hypothetical protein